VCIKPDLAACMQSYLLVRALHDTGSRHVVM